MGNNYLMSGLASEQIFQIDSGHPCVSVINGLSSHCYTSVSLNSACFFCFVFFLSCSPCLSEAYWSTWWGSALSVTLTPTAAKAAHHMTTATRTTATPMASTATGVTDTLTEGTGMGMGRVGMVGTATPTARQVEA